MRTLNEQLQKYGVNSFTDIDLIQTITGASEEQVKSLLKGVNYNLKTLTRFSFAELKEYGLTENQSAKMIAAFEFRNRRNLTEAIEGNKITNGEDAYNYFKGLGICDNDFEISFALFLNRANKIVGHAKLSEGGVHGTVICIQKLFRLALQNKASALILCHNHPSGNLRPSDSDIQLTKRAIEAGKIMDCAVLDHLILGSDAFYSFANEGLM